MEDRRHVKQASRIVFSVFIAIGLLFIVYFIPLPLYVFKPGTAEVLAPMVQVKQAAGADRGEFMLTTVELSDVNLVSYVLSFVRLIRNFGSRRSCCKTTKPARSTRSGKKL